MKFGLVVARVRREQKQKGYNTGVKKGIRMRPARVFATAVFASMLLGASVQKGFAQECPPKADRKTNSKASSPHWIRPTSYTQ